MSLFGSLVSAISNQPGPFLFLRGLVENDFRAIRAVIREELCGKGAVRTLDLGCGPGAFSTAFPSEGYLGVDLNPRYIGYAQRHFRGRFRTGDARQLEEAVGAFDQVLVFGLLHHLDDAACRQVLAEARRVLRPGGLALVIEDIPAVSHLNLLGHLIHWAENGSHIRPADDYRRLYQASFEIVRERVLRSGLCDYHAAVLMTPTAAA